MYYIKDYEEFKKALTKKYGEPFYDGEEWLNDSLKKYYEDDKGLKITESDVPADLVEKCEEYRRELIEALAEFNDEVDLFVLDGDKINALPSTIVSVCDGNFKIIRQGCLKID